MSKKLHRIMFEVLSLVMLLCAMGVYASAETYKVGDIFESQTADATLPTLTNPALAWKGPETLYEIHACGKQEHTHSLESCKYREARDDENPDFGKNIYYIPKYDESGDYTWVECTKEDYDKARHALMVYTYFVWDCGYEAHTHTDDCNEITGYQWKVVKSNLNEHIVKHIEINFKKTGESAADVINANDDVSNVSVTVTYADSADNVETLTDLSRDDDNGWVYKTGVGSTKYTTISNDTDNNGYERIVGVEIKYTYNDAEYTYSVDTFAGLEAAHLACPNNQWASGGLDFDIQVASQSNYYYKIVKNYLLDNTVVYSQTIGDGSDAVKTGLAKITVTPESEATYNGETYKLDKTGSSYTDVDISSSLNNSANAVALTLNYKRCSVSHEFVSATEGKTLPEGVMSQLPDNTSVPMGNSAAPEASTFNTVYEYVNGSTVRTWTFAGWDKDIAENINEPVTFTGSWNCTESDSTEGVYSITCKFVSGTDGMELPAGVTNQLPEGIVLPNGTAAPDDFSFEPFTERDANGNLKGRWNLDSWVKESDSKGNLTYTGTWKFTAIDTYGVIYKWAEGSDVPTGAVVPTDSKTYCAGETVTIAANPTSASTQKGDLTGKWEFLGWDTSALPDGKMVAPTDGSKNVTVVGSWRFTEADKYSYTLVYIGNGGTKGSETALTDSESVENTTSTSVAMTVDANPFTYDHYEFQGWAESLEAAAAGNATIQPNSTITFTPQMTGKTLYAVWKRVDFSLTVTNSSTGYDFKDGDTLSFGVSVNGNAKDTYIISYSASDGWGSFTVDNLKKDDIVTVTELEPAKSGYTLSVTDASGADVAASEGNYAQTLTMADDDTNLSFVNKYAVKSAEDTPAASTTATTNSPYTDDSSTNLILYAALMLMSAAAVFVAARKRKTK